MQMHKCILAPTRKLSSPHLKRLTLSLHFWAPQLRVPFDPITAAFVPGGFEEHTKQYLHNLRAIIEWSGSEVGTAVKFTVRVSLYL